MKSIQRLILFVFILYTCVSTGDTKVRKDEEKGNAGIIVGVIGNSTQIKGPLGTIVTITNVKGILPDGVQAYPLEPTQKEIAQLLIENSDQRKNLTIKVS